MADLALLAHVLLIEWDRTMSGWLRHPVTGVVDRAAGHPSRRRAVKRTIAWLLRFRGLLVRYEVYDRNYLGWLMSCSG